MAAPVVSMVLNQLGTFLREEIHKEVIMVLGVKEEIEKLELTLTAIQAVLHDADKKQVQDQRVKVWLERLKKVVYEIEDILDKWNTKIIQSKIRTQSKDTKGIREKLDSIDRDKNNYGLASGMPTETLKLNRCKELRKLPASIGNMISLRHLEIYDTKSLRSLPEGIERLASLRSLSKFIVSEGRNLGDLKGLNLIQGRIEISGLRRVKSVNEAKEVHLANKRGIHALALDFGSNVITEGDEERMEGVLEGLQPHTNLEELKINGYPGFKLPSWMILFSKLRTLELMDLSQCTTLPSLGRLPLLEVLKIGGMKSVRRLGLDFLGISDIEDATTSIGRGQLIAFPSLVELELHGMSELEEWVLPFERSDILQIMPRLRKLYISNAPNLKALPALGILESLEELYISLLISVKRIGPEFFVISEDVISRCICSEKLVVFPNLIQLELNLMWKLKEWVLPFERSDDTLQIMPRLRKLTIGRAYKLKVLPALGRLESLEELTISGLHSLKRIGPEFFGILEDDDVMKGTSGSSRGGGSLPIIVLPKLKKLQFFDMEEWEEWEMMMPSWREDISFVMPCLKEFELWLCKKLKVVPHNIFSYQPVKERIEGCPQLNQRLRRNQIIRRREVGESYNRRMDYFDDDDFTAQPTPLGGELIICL
ncbi:hypothetical protein GIB67_027910 [Kingdonia uniflora]|uniref:Rx N-terminal domain-containing protein n=1 Tax=Kingdonia uniflora TaxID=39325 RepID=A0A7J7LGL9_9MAGN|nr:hypothetical protein GIB67_027910 [Kingdonia uniflora]